MADSRQVALITGASRGIGKAVAQRLARDGFKVALNYAASRQPAEELAEEIRAAGGQAVALQGDVSRQEDVEKLFAGAEAALGRIDVLVNNAGIMKIQKIADTSDETFRQTFDTNVAGVFNALRLASTRLNDGGRIINFSTTAIALGMPGYAVYVASKAAVEAMSYVLAKELRGRRITVNCIAPGPTATDLFLRGKSEQQIQHLANLSPLERLGQPEDIARVVSFLAGPDGAWVNAQVLRANGGVI
jgi:3-oxoacyl-[acyl-carrier protein] reductase